MKKGAYDYRNVSDEDFSLIIKYLGNKVNNRKHIIKEQLKKINFNYNKTLVDVGCGTGDITKLAACLYDSSNVMGIDFNEKMIEYCIKNNMHHNVTYRVEDCYNINLDNDSFDCVYSRLLLDHLYDPEAALKELIRITKHEGYIGLYSADEGYTCFEPKPIHFEKIIKANKSLIRFTGGSLLLGRKLYGMLYRNGIQSIKVDKIFFDSTDPGRDVLINELMIYEDINNHIYVTTGLIKAHELKEYYDDVEKITKNEDSYVATCDFFVYGKVIKS